MCISHKNSINSINSINSFKQWINSTHIRQGSDSSIKTITPESSEK